MQHEPDETGQFFGEVAVVTALTDLAPVDGTLSDEGSVEKVAADVCLIERWKAHDHRKERSSEREQIDLVTFVRFARQNFRSFQALGTEVRAQYTFSESSEHGAGQAEVSDLKIIVTIEKHVLQFHIPMSNAFLVNVVQGLKRLTKIMSRQRFVKTTSCLHHVEELAVGGVLKDSVVNFHGALVVDVQTVTLRDHAQHILVIEVLHHLELREGELSDVLLEVVIQQLHGDKLLVRQFCKLDDASAALPDDMVELHTVQCLVHFVTHTADGIAF